MWCSADSRGFSKEDLQEMGTKENELGDSEDLITQKEPRPNFHKEVCLSLPKFWKLTV